MARVAMILLVGAIIISVVLHVCFERPVNTWLRRWWIRRKGASFADPAVT
jgi:peptidoglycan/LPS O-acetylase OafA/YrhL